MSTATQHKFKVGQRVEMTLEALAAHLDCGRRQRRTGIVVDFYPDEQMVWVLRDGTKRAVLNHYSRWQPISPESIAPNDRCCPTCGQKLP